MDDIKICYTDALNLGDSINPIIIKNIFGYNPILSNEWNCDITGIGSGLRRFFVAKESKPLKFHIKRKAMNILSSKPLIIWSAGFLSTPSDDEILVRHQIRVSSVRGLLSKQHIEKILGSSLDCTVGDAGILVSKLFSSNIEKKYQLGIIPHRKDKSSSIVDALKEYYPNSIVIDIEPTEPLKGLKEISECECILSSSLHGLVFADSFRIPNKHIIMSDNLSGDGFKFDDYYSAYSLVDHPIDLRNGIKVNLDNVLMDYAISDSQVTKMQNDCEEAFYRFLL